MGLTQSTIRPAASAEPEKTVQTNQVVVESVKSPDTTTDIPATEAPTAETKVIESVITQPAEKVSDDKTTTTQLTEQITESMVFERYIETPGTKVEVAPVEVAPTDDVVKKNKKKHKNKNKNKD
jgi:hypothetical protein